MRLITLENAFYGGLIYAGGDSIATLINHSFQWQRLIGMFMLGATLYAIEIPAYFAWLDKRYAQPSWGNALKRMLLALGFFNPLWIARHLAFIEFFAGRWHNIDWHLVTMATTSFLYCVPVSLLMNYLIQNVLSLRWRYVASSVYSAVLAIYYALTEVLFG
jgi:hypothetical protein